MTEGIVAALIGAAGAVLAAIAGGVVGRSDAFERFVRRAAVHEVLGEWVSEWQNQTATRTEIIELRKVRGHRVYGIVTDPALSHNCEVEGVFAGRFLQLLWHPDKQTRRALVDDFGCYFFEKQPDGSFKGKAIGFYYDVAGGSTQEYTHTLRRRQA